LRERNLSRIIGIFLIIVIVNPAFSLQEESRSICVAPLPKPIQGADGSIMGGDPSLTCRSQKYGLKIDQQRVVPWPVNESVSITTVSPIGRHRVVVLCDNKALQSFTFRFSDYKGKKLCLFLNDLYWTVQLWPAKGAPWCKCK
jgi:hypothetical protein